MILFVSIGYIEYEKIYIEDCLFSVPMYINWPNFDEKSEFWRNCNIFKKADGNILIPQVFSPELSIFKVGIDHYLRQFFWPGVTLRQGVIYIYIYIFIYINIHTYIYIYIYSTVHNNWPPIFLNIYWF